MEFKKEILQTCSQATGIVVVIDVIRAFTTAAFAFAEPGQSLLPWEDIECCID